MSVANYLNEKFGASLSPGEKGKCVWCGKATLSIVSNDTLAYCFHPLCGRYVNVASLNRAGYLYYLNNALIEILSDSYKELLDDRSNNGYKYLTEERKIAPQVIEDAMIGVVPEKIDADNKFKPVFDELDDQLDRASRQ